MDKNQELNHNEHQKLQTEANKDQPTVAKKGVSFFKLQYTFMHGWLSYLNLIIGIIGSLGLGISMPIFAVIFGDTINQLNPENMISPTMFVQNIQELCLKFFYVGLGMFAAGFLLIRCWNYNGRTISFNLKKYYFQILMMQEQGYFDACNKNEFSSKIQAQTKTIEGGLGDKVGNSLMSLSMTVSAFAVGFSYNWKLSLVLISLFPLIAIGGFFAIAALRGKAIKGMEAYAQAGGVAEELLYNIKTVSSFANYDFEIQRFNKNLDKSFREGKMGGLLAGSTMSFLFMVIFATYCLAIWFGSTLIANREINYTTGRPFGAGDVIIVLFTVLFGSISVGQAAPNFNAISQACGAAHELFELMKRVPRIDISKSTVKPPKEEFTGRIEFRNVDFAYPTTPDQVFLKDFNLSIEAGKTTAIVGESGTGKSTIVSLLERLYDVTNGEILIDGYNLKTLDLNYYRTLIGYVPQEPVLLNVSIRDNIIFGREGITDEMIWDALNKAYASDFVNAITEKLDYIVGIKGSKLSGGQKQRIAIARAILTKPKLLILDEATSALDNESEKAVKVAFNNISKDTTTISIAHRLSTIIKADKIVVFKKVESVGDGKIYTRIVEEGNHDYLLSLNGHYSHLIKSQLAELSDEDRNAHVDINEIVEIPIETETVNNRVETKSLIEKKQSARPSVEEKFHSEMEQKIQEEKRKKEEFEKWADKTKSKLWPILMKHKCVVVSSAFFAMCAGAVWPVYGILLADSITALSQMDSEAVRRDGFLLSMYFLALAGGAAVAIFFQNYFFALIGEYMTRQLREDTFRKYMRLHMGYFDKIENTPGALLTKLSSDTTKINGIALSMVGVSVQTISTLLIATVLGFIFDWRLSLINLAFMPFIFMSSMFNYKLQKGFTDVEDVVDTYAGAILSESVNNTPTIYAYNMQSKVVDLYSNILKSAMKKFYKTLWVNAALFGFGQFVMFATYAALFYAGSHFMLKDLSFQNMFRAIFTLLFAAFGLGQAQQYVGDLSKGKEALVNVFKTIDEPSLIDPYPDVNSDNGKRLTSPIKGHIQFVNVGFSYPNRPEEVVFKDLNLEILPGQSVAFVGSSGSGKSTIIQLIERFYDVTEGQILIDGIDIRDYDVVYLRQMIGIVMQEPIIFKRNMTENIRYGKLDATDGEVIAVSQKAEISDFVIGGSKNNEIPSGGQRQRVAIARAMIKDPKILLLDEATSALDKNTEISVQKSLDELMEGRTSIVVAHRLSTIEKCDKIYVLNKGKILESGTHHQLLESKGAYYRLHLLGQGEGNVK